MKDRPLTSKRTNVWGYKISKNQKHKIKSYKIEKLSINETTCKLYGFNAGKNIIIHTPLYWVSNTEDVKSRTSFPNHYCSPFAWFSFQKSTTFSSLLRYRLYCFPNGILGPLTSFHYRRTKRLLSNFVFFCSIFLHKFLPRFCHMLLISKPITCLMSPYL